MKRRDFLKSAALISAGTMVHPWEIFPNQSNASVSYFSLHPFIEAHPDAVFIKRSAVDVKTNAAAKLYEGKQLAKDLFILSDQPGIPLNQTMALKPNLTCTFGTGHTADGMGIQTDHDFLEGVIEGMRESGFDSSRMYLREGNWLGDGYCSNEITIDLMQQMSLRQGFHILDFPTGRGLQDITLDTIVDNQEVIWRDCPDGYVFKRIGYVAPYNETQSWTLNIAKFKTHSMGMTLAAKNMQGMCISPYVRFCEGVDNTRKHPASVLSDFQADFEQRMDSEYTKHVQAGIPRWDRPGRDASGGYGMETWAHRTCDSHSVNKAGLSIIEGIYGRNGNGFTEGPGPGNTPQEFMSNILIFGKNPFLVDVIGTWLAGHEPGNFGLFHIAKERGLCDNFNPATIPLYDWGTETPSMIELEELTRTPLLCPYLQQDYNGGDEEKYHLVNEAFVYDSNPVNPISAPAIFTLGQNYSNPFSVQTIIEYTLPAAGRISLEVFNSSGQRVGILARGLKRSGTHMATWNASGFPSGTYYYTLKTPDGKVTRHMKVIR
jgi:Domain of unknown function (DUF362)